MARRLHRSLCLFVWVALLLTGVAIGDMAEDLVEAAGADGPAAEASPEVENPVENALVPSQELRSDPSLLHRSATFPPPVVGLGSLRSLGELSTVGQADRSPPRSPSFPHSQPSPLPLRL